ncbi:FIST C-terminal domain-containing protein [Candidatus Parcubacteria bacterium]|nr:FIST C-terminal domain-containing protein [Candidatus Parcubacteria bacterium]
MAAVNIGIGISQKDNLIEAAKEAAGKAKQEIGSKKPKLLMFFVELSYVVRYPEKNNHEQALAVIREVFPDKDTPLVGGTVVGFFAKGKYYFNIELASKTTGVLLKPLSKIIKSLKFNGVCVLALESPLIKIGTGIGLNTDKDPKKAGFDSIKMALDELEWNPSLAYMSLLKRSEKGFENIRYLDTLLLTSGDWDVSEQRGFHHAQILEGIDLYTKKMTKIIGGGLAGQGKGPGIVEKPFVFFNNKVEQNAVISIVFDSDLKIGYGVDTGIENIEPIGIITKGENWTIEEINKKPAFDVLSELFKKYTDISKEEFEKFGFKTWMKGWTLSFSDTDTDFYWPLVVLGVKDKKVIVGQTIKTGMGLNLAKLTKETTQKATQTATKKILKDIEEKKFHFAFFFSCGARYYVLGTQYLKEAEAIKKTLGQDIPIFGITASGEQGFYKIGRNVSSNFIFSIMGISDQLS